MRYGCTRNLIYKTLVPGRGNMLDDLESESQRSGTSAFLSRTHMELAAGILPPGFCNNAVVEIVSNARVPQILGKGTYSTLSTPYIYSYISPNVWHVGQESGDDLESFDLIRGGIALHDPIVDAVPAHRSTLHPSMALSESVKCGDTLRRGASCSQSANIAAQTCFVLSHPSRLGAAVEGDVGRPRA